MTGNSYCSVHRLVRVLLVVICSLLVVRGFFIKKNVISYDRRFESQRFLCKSNNDFQYIQKHGKVTNAVRMQPRISVARGRIYGSSSKTLVRWNNKSFSGTYVILLANILVYLFTFNSPWLMQKYIKNNYRISKGDWYRLLSALFLHGNLSHIAMNSLSLYNIGPQVESIYGTWKFLCLYFGSGIIANFATYLLNKSPFSLGASGCTYGLLGAYAGYFYQNQYKFGRGSEYILDSMKRNIAINIMYGFMQSHTDSWAHIGGLVAGASLSFLFSPPGSANSIRR